MTPTVYPWWRTLNRYHWYVLIISSLGWMFDTMDQQLFVLARQASVRDVIHAKLDQPVWEDVQGVPTPRPPLPAEREQRVTQYGGYATAVFLIGWATGGLVFGMFGDRWGRVRTMLFTILMYSVCTGLSALAVGWWDYAFYRFLTGMGVGGEFAAGVALVAEVMPAAARPFALGLMQSLSAVGNMMAAIITRVVPPGVEFSRWGEGTEAVSILGWRVVFLIGILPSLLLLVARSRLKEPDSWLAAKARAAGRGTTSDATDANRQLGDLRELLTHPTYRSHTLIGVLLALSGVMMLWGAGFFTPELIRNHLGIADPAQQDHYASVGLFLQNLGSLLGMCVFGMLAPRFGRRPSFAVAYLLGLSGVILVFGFMTSPEQIYWMMPLFGFCLLMVFAGFAIYFPELFPTRLRSTGTGFCYNVARYLTAFGPLLLPQLQASYLSRDATRKAGGLADLTWLSSFGGSDAAFRYATITVASMSLIGLVTLLFAPETKDRPLPE